MIKKCCKTCKYGQCTFGYGLKEELQLWECNATLFVVPSNQRAYVSTTPNHYCNWWNQPRSVVEKDVKAWEKEAEELRRKQKGVCIGKIVY